MPTESTFWGWCVKGLGGAINIAGMLADGKAPITGHWRTELRQLWVRLGHLLEHVERPDYPSG